MQQGTPYIYQGQEIGMTNYPFESIDDFQDVVVTNVRRVFGVFEPLFRPIILKVLKVRARDNARTPMQWDDSENAGFTKGTPWFLINPNYTEINTKNDLLNHDSILNFYKKLIKYRLNNEVIIKGYYQEYNSGNEDLHVYIRTYNGVTILVVCNYKNKEVSFNPHPETVNKNCNLVLHNYGYDRPVLEPMILRPYEALVYELNKTK
jgi:oligo-1,6-glucosidase